MNNYQYVEPTIETHPDNPLFLAVQHWFFKGKTLSEVLEEHDKEREMQKNKEEILTMHQLGIESGKIALIKKVEKKYVEQVIAESKNKAVA